MEGGWEESEAITIDDGNMGARRQSPHHEGGIGFNGAYRDNHVERGGVRLGTRRHHVGGHHGERHHRHRLPAVKTREEVKNKKNDDDGDDEDDEDDKSVDERSSLTHGDLIKPRITPSPPPFF